MADEGVADDCFGMLFVELESVFAAGERCRPDVVPSVLAPVGVPEDEPVDDLSPVVDEGAEDGFDDVDSAAVDADGVLDVVLDEGVTLTSEVFGVSLRPHP